MDVVIRCENCQTTLRVPSESSGHTARCPSCKTLFTVPTLKNMLEETITGWIVNDVEEIEEDRVRTTDKRVASEKPKAGRQPPPKKTAPVEDDFKSDLDDQQFWKVKAPPSQPFEYDLPPATSTHENRPPVEAKSHKGKTRGYPTNLRTKDPLAHLVVHRVNTAGVRFAFDSHWLKDERFRASLPVQCVLTGTTDRSQLIARPLLFVDRLFKSHDSVENVISAHTFRQLSDKHPREIVRTMGKIELLPEPFCFAMPYYIATRFARQSLYAQTHDRSSGSVTCDVLIPDHPTALAWLGRVNGVCGPEFERLERDVSLLHGSVWQQLDEACRQQLNTWCKLDPDETFQHYFNDADFGSKDAGLAGLVVTDDRILFKKHHRQGQIDLSHEDACIVAKREGNLAKLTFQCDNQHSRMVTLRLADLDKLAEMLEDEAISFVMM